MEKKFPSEVSQLITMALEEDIREGDVTSLYFVPEERKAHGMIVGRADGIVAGLGIAEEVFRRVDPDLKLTIHASDGDRISQGEALIELEGSARSILTGERVALNFMQRLSGVASKTRLFVDLVKGTETAVLDTRKTTPGWRWLEKYAVRTGGGKNHRMGLYDRAMVKDNHLVAEGGLPAIESAIRRLKKEKPAVEVELEADTLDQARSFMEIEGVDYILLDNMSLEELRKAVSLRKAMIANGESSPLLEASGGVNLSTVADIAKTGVDFVSVGALTHSAVALDLAMDFLEK